MADFLCSHPWLNLFLALLGLGSLIGGGFWIAVAIFGTAADFGDYERDERP